jgi:hypothetical protein
MAEAFAKINPTDPLILSSAIFFGLFFFGTCPNKELAIQQSVIEQEKIWRGSERDFLKREFPCKLSIRIALKTPEVCHALCAGVCETLTTRKDGRTTRLKI